MERCPHCPVDAGETCLAVARGRRRYCELVDPANPDAYQRESYTRHLRGEMPPVASNPPPAPAPVETPSLVTQFVTATQAAATFVASGFEALPEADVQARLAICNGCDQRTAGGMCSGCGCWLAAKARLPHEVCPAGKWPTPPERTPEPTNTGSPP